MALTKFLRNPTPRRCSSDTLVDDSVRPGGYFLLTGPRRDKFWFGKRFDTASSVACDFINGGKLSALVFRNTHD